MPVLLLQIVVLNPASIILLDALLKEGRVSIGWLLLRPFRNPALLGSAAGITVALTGIELPPTVLAPFELVGAASIPLMLLAFGMSLRGWRPLRTSGRRADVIVATALKLVAMPLTAWLVARFAFEMDGHALFVVTALAMLPTGQFVYNAAARYGVAQVVARDTIMLTSILSLPALILAAALLAPG